MNDVILVIIAFIGIAFCGASVLIVLANIVRRMIEINV